MVLETLQPLGVVVAIIAFAATSYGLWLTRVDMDRRQMEVHATLRMTLDEKLRSAALPIDQSNFGRKTCPPKIPGDNGALVTMVQSMAALGVPLTGLRAYGVPLSSLKLRDGEFEDTGWSLSDLSRADYSGSNLEAPEFFCADLEFADFIGSTLTRADFRLAVLRNADFSGATFDGVDFSGANLSGAVFHGVDLSSAKFLGARLDGTDFQGATELDRNETESACLRQQRNLPKGLPHGWKPEVRRDCPNKDLPLL